MAENNLERHLPHLHPTLGAATAYENESVALQRKVVPLHGKLA